VNLLDLTLRTPAENLACDEALLDAAEAGEIGEVLRFWESPDPFVVLGYSCPIDREVNLDACVAHDVPVLRRCSGGGTVVQGPGCLNYTLILRITPGTPFEHLTTTNSHIMQRHADALSRLLHNKIAVCGITDLAINNLKFSGNAQRRKRNHLLFHGTLLYNFKLPLIEQLLHPPVRQPDYRANRPHHAFVMNLPTTAGALKAVIRTCWKPDGLLSHIPLHQIHDLAVNRYTRPEWTCKF
jgi:lipoate-protein ligase A